MELKDTVDMMESSDYKERFRAEYFQLEIRIDKLITMLSKWDIGELGFQPTCPYNLLEAQLNSMKTYRYILEERAKLENINLDR